MKYVYIKGVHFENKGAELMMRTLLQKLDELGEYKVVLTACDAAPYESRCELKAYQYFSLSAGKLDLNRLVYWLPQKVRNWLNKQYGIVFESDLYAILDASGYAYGDKWPLRGLERTCGQLKRFKKFNKKYIFMPQMLGPFKSTQAQQLVKQYLPFASLIVAREETSEKCVTDITGNLDNLVVGPDFTNLLTVEKTERIANKMLVIPNSNMVSARSGHKDWQEKYMGILEAIIESALNKNFAITILNHEGGSDKPLCEQLYQKYSGKVELIQNYNALQIKAAIAESGIVVSSRFHGCVSALSQGVACIGTSWSHKYEELYSDYDASELLLSNPAQFDDYASLFEAIIDKQNAIESRIVAKRKIIKQTSQRTWELIKAKLTA